MPLEIEITDLQHRCSLRRRIAFVCWRGAAENEWVRLPMCTMQSIVPLTAPPDPEAPGPFSFGEGGTRDAAIDDAVKMALEVGPLSRVLAAQPDDIHPALPSPSVPSSRAAPASGR